MLVVLQNDTHIYSKDPRLQYSFICSYLSTLEILEVYSFIIDGKLCKMHTECD